MHQNELPFNSKGKSLLSVMVYCAHCGSKLVLTTSSGRRAKGEPKRETRIRYACHYKIRHPQDCDGQTGYSGEKLDGIIDKIVIQLFEDVYKRQVDGRTLMDRPLEPPNFVVDTLLSQGLHILAGSPKVGKSWLALWLAVTVAKGEAVWGMGVKQGTTLYLCLEDFTLRIQNRLFEITEDAPASVHFSTSSDTLGKEMCIRDRLQRADFINMISP